MEGCLFDEHERKVFSYYDGQEERMGDPLAVYAELVCQCDGDLDGAVKASRRQAPEGHPEGEALPPESPDAYLGRMQAQKRLLAGVRVALAMVPFDGKTGKGATDQHVLAAMNRFFGWTEKNWPGGDRTGT